MIFELLLAVILSPVWLIINALPETQWSIASSFTSLWSTFVSLASPLGIFVVPSVVNAMIVANAIILPVVAIGFFVKYLARLARS